MKILEPTRGTVGFALGMLPDAVRLPMIEASRTIGDRKRAGLTPGPIASPGKRSIQAALYPANTDYLFFVVDATRNDGSHKFSASSAEHERAVQLYRQQEREIKAQ